MNNDCEILIPGFQLYRFDRHRHGGGVRMYVSDELLVSVLPPPSPPLEILALSVLSVNFKLHLCLFYCPPSSTSAIKFCHLRTYRQPVDAGIFQMLCF